MSSRQDCGHPHLIDPVHQRIFQMIPKSRLLAIVTAAALLSACGAVAAPISEQTATVSRGDIASTVNATGSLSAREELKLAFLSSGTIARVLVKPGESVAQGAVLAELETTDTQSELDKANTRIASAEAGLIIARANYSRTVAGPRASEIAAAQSAVVAARQQADKVAAGPSAADRAAAEARIKNAESDLRRAQSAYDAAFAFDPAGIGASGEASQLERATNDYALAKAEYDRAVQPAAQADKSAAARSISEAQATLDKLRQPVAAYEIERANAEVTQARIALEQAKLEVTQLERRLNQSRIVAPKAAVVSAVDIRPGETANLQNTAITLVDLTGLLMDINVDEIDVARVQPGQSVQVTLDALPGVTLSGKVNRIAPTARTVNGVVSYPVRVELPAEQARARPGMTASAKIILEERTGVLLVPNWAVRRDGESGKSYLTVADPAAGENKTKEIEVQTGLRDGENTEIASGASEGDTVRAPALQ
jgi:HlyD family secretion protein